MLETAFAKGTKLTGSIAQMFFKEDVKGQNAEKAATAEEFTPPGGSGKAIFLPYRPGAINYVVPQGRDVISSRFTGCYMVKYKKGGETRVAHVATPECNAAWQALKAGGDVTVEAEFKPTDHVNVQALDAAGKSGGKGEILGIITANGYCVAVAASRTGAASATGDSTALEISALTLAKSN